MAPSGIKVLLRERPKDCRSCSPHALFEWYIRPSLENYHCHKICIPATNSVSIGQTVYWFPHKLIMPTDGTTNIIIVTAKYLTLALKKINKNPILPPSDTITRKAFFQLDSVFSNVSSALKSKQPPIFEIPRVSTPKPVAAPPRLYPSTTQGFHNIFPTTQKHCRGLQAAKSKNSPKTSPFLSPSPKFNSIPRPITSSLDNTVAAFTTMNLLAKLQHIVQQ